MKKFSMRVKGFTLTELIIVIAIIGVLAAVLAPSMTTYYWKSRVKSANSDAKMVYNAAQTAAQRFIAKDRTAAEASGLDNVLVISYEGGSFKYSTPTIGWTSDTSTTIGQTAEEIVTSVNRTVSGAEQKCWAVQIHNYIVEGSAAADSAGTTLVGYYTAGAIRIPDSRPNVTYTNFCQGDGTGDTTFPKSLADVVKKYETATT